jgi:beta-lactamase class A
MNAPDYSVFFKELYNGSYLSFENSEACMQLLSNTDFNEGMIAGLPAGAFAAHKFGEGGPDTEPNFCESALIYNGNRPYLLTVMTKGKDIKKLPAVIKEISKKVYEIMNVQG